MAAHVNQLGNTANGSTPAVATYYAPGEGPDTPGTVTIEGDAPARRLNAAVLRQLGAKYKGLFDRFASERQPAEQKWLKNLRQYLGVYDPEIDRQLDPTRSRAYPRLTRIKCIAMLSRLMNLMFPGNEDSWEVTASPSPEMSPDMVAQAVSELMNKLAQPGEPGPDGQPGPPVMPELTQELVEEAVRALATKQAKMMSDLIKDQLNELGGGQTVDWIALNRKVIDSGIKYGIGVLEGPYVRTVQTSGWMLEAAGPDGKPTFKNVSREVHKPQYDHLPVWDFYPDMAARTAPGEGYFVRKVLGRVAFRRLGQRPDFFERQIKEVITQLPGGNYKAKSFESELKTMGLSIHSDQQSVQSSGRDKYEIIIWKGPVSAATLTEAGVDIPEDKRADDVQCELWMVENWIIKAEINAWRKLGVDMVQAHVFNFDEDDTSCIGQGLPGIVRDSQLSVCAATRMTLDNASVTCGPNLEVNTSLMRADQDLTAVVPYKIWYRDDEGLTAQYPAVRRVEIDGHLNELQGLVKMFLEFADMETFIGPATGGDFQKMPSEPMRTAAGASMLRGDAALPFKDIVRNYDSFTQSVIWSLVQFNKKLNPDLAPEGDYDAIPRGATSLIAKEVRGMQIDALSQTLTPEERDHVDERKFVEAKFAARDMQGMLVSPDEAARRQQARAEEMQRQQQMQEQMLAAQIQDTKAGAFKSVTQGQKNAATADKTQVDAATAMIGLTGDNDGGEGTGDGTGAAAAGRS